MTTNSVATSMKVCSVPNCGRLVGRNGCRGMCEAHHRRLLDTGDVRADVPLRAYGLPIEERFWSKVDKDGPAPDYAPHLGPCWLWTDRPGNSGYGTFQVDGRANGAHRFSYEVHVGPIADGLVIDHLCRVKMCVNPAHLEPVTVVENARRGVVSEVQRARHARRRRERVSE